MPKCPKQSAKGLKAGIPSDLVDVEGEDLESPTWTSLAPLNWSWWGKASWISNQSQTLKRPTWALPIILDNTNKVCSTFVWGRIEPLEWDLRLFHLGSVNKVCSTLFEVELSPWNEVYICSVWAVLIRSIRPRFRSNWDLGTRSILVRLGQCKLNPWNEVYTCSTCAVQTKSPEQVLHLFNLANVYKVCSTLFEIELSRRTRSICVRSGGCKWELFDLIWGLNLAGN